MENCIQLASIPRPGLRSGDRSLHLWRGFTFGCGSGPADCNPRISYPALACSGLSARRRPSAGRSVRLFYEHSRTRRIRGSTCRFCGHGKEFAYSRRVISRRGILSVAFAAAFSSRKNVRDQNDMQVPTGEAKLSGVLEDPAGRHGGLASALKSRRDDR
jgi:hypothetical protein